MERKAIEKAHFYEMKEWRNKVVNLCFSVFKFSSILVLDFR